MPPVIPPHPSFLYDLGDWTLFTAIPPIVLFTAFYFFRSNWRATGSGRALMWLTGSMTVVLVLTAVTRFLGPNWPGREWVRLAAYFFVSLAVWRLFFLLIKTQFLRRDDHETTVEASEGPGASR